MNTKTLGAQDSKRVRACALHAKLIANTDALYADEIDHEEHGRINGGIWREIESGGLQRAVSALLRGDQDDFEEALQS